MDPSAQGPQQLVGREISGYRLERVLGTGATGAVFLAERVEASEASDALPQRAAMKVLMLPMQATAEERLEFRRQLEREASAASALHSPQIVPVLASGEDAATGFPYIIMPYVAGGTLSKRLTQGPLPLPEVSEYLAQLAAALDYAHARGLVHRDLKPANILLDDDGHLLLTDFGIARVFEATRTRMTTTGRVLGTPEYMSPEQAQGEHADPAADIYSLGIIVYQMVTGRVPFQAPSFAGLLIAHLTEPPPPPRALRPDLPVPAEAAIIRALAKDPHQRFASAGLFARAFAAGHTSNRADTPPAPGGSRSTPGETVGQYTPPPTVYAPIGMPSPQAVSPHRVRRGSTYAALAGVLLLAVGLLMVLGNGSTLQAFLTSLSSSTPSPTAVPLPTTIRPGQRLYTANWSQGLAGWDGADDWQVVNGALVSNCASKCNILAPYMPSTADYAVDAKIAVVGISGTDGFGGIITRVEGDPSQARGYIGSVAALQNANGEIIGIPTISFIGGGNDISAGNSLVVGTATHDFLFEVEGHLLTLYIDGTRVCQNTDDTFQTSGRVGVRAYVDAQISVTSLTVTAL